MSTTTPIVLASRWLELPLADGTARFHYRWLRHACDLDRHPTTKERIVCSSEIPDDIRAADARITDGDLRVTWAHDRRESSYALAWLDRHAYDRGHARAPELPTDVRAFEIDRGDGDLADAVARAAGLLAARGAAIVRANGRVTRPEDETEALIEAFEHRGLDVISTHFGRIEDLRTDNTTNQNTDQLGYTDSGIELHTDQPFLESPPRIQILQSIRPADEGGENYLVDALAASRRLSWEDRGLEETLRRVPIVFHRQQRSFESVVKSPILQGDGDDFLVRYSYFTLAPHALPFAEMENYYRAYDRFARLVRDPSNQLRFRLGPGDFLIYDNHRMLHARTAFRGARWVRGIYLDRAPRSVRVAS